MVNLYNGVLWSETEWTHVAQDLHYVRDYSIIDVETLKNACRIDDDDTSNDVFLSLILAGVKDKADAYLQRPSFDIESGLPVEIPSAVNLWVLQTSIRMFEQKQMGVKRVDIKDAQVTEWGDIDYSLLFPYRLFFGL